VLFVCHWNPQPASQPATRQRPVSLRFPNTKALHRVSNQLSIEPRVPWKSAATRSRLVSSRFPKTLLAGRGANGKQSPVVEQLVHVISRPGGSYGSESAVHADFYDCIGFTVRRMLLSSDNALIVALQ